MSEASIGNVLKRTRQTKGLNYSEVQNHIRIHASVLEKLEENNFTALPAPIYAKGFLKKYSDFLGLNTAELLQAFDHLGIRKVEQHLVVGNRNVPQLLSKRKSFRSILRKYTRPLIRIAFAVLVVLMVVSFLRWARNIIVSSVQKPQTRSHAAPIIPTQTQRRTPPRAVPVDERDLINSPSRNNFPVIGPNDRLRLSISASTDAWIRLTADDEVLFEAILKRGQVEEWVADTRIQIKVGRPKAVSMVLNGYPLGRPGDGRSTHILLNRAGIREI